MHVRNNDECHKQQSDAGILQYNTFNYYTKTDMGGPSLNRFDGYGITPSIADVGLATRDVRKHELHPREFQAAPDYGKGPLIPDTESYLINGSDSRLYKSCDKFSSTDYNRYTPLNACVGSFIKTEMANTQSVFERVGKPSRPYSSVKVT